MKTYIFFYLILFCSSFTYSQNILGKQSYDNSPAIYIPPGYSALSKSAEIASQKAMKNKEYCDAVEKYIVNILPRIRIESTLVKLEEILKDVESIKKDLTTDKSFETELIAYKLSLINKQIEIENKIAVAENSLFKKDWEKCIDILNELQDENLSELHDWKYHSLSTCYSKLNDVKNTFNSINKLHDKSLSTLLKAVAKHELKDYYGSNQEYEYMLENNYFPEGYDKATVLNNIAYNYLKLKKFDISSKFINEALELNNNISYIWDTKGEIQYNLAKYQECINTMTTAIKLDNSSENSYYYRGQAYLKLGEKEKACQDFSKAGELGNEDAYNLIGKNCN